MSFKGYMLTLMRDADKGGISAAIKAVLEPLSLVYSACVRTIDWAYRRGIRRVHSVDVPVISVGNLTLGGTGKTPLCILLAGELLSRGKTPAIISRGVGGDEDRMIREELPGIRVITGQDRVKSALAAEKDGSDVIIMDDGFQHRRLSRDLDIVVVDGSVLLGNRKVFPRGVLREPLSALKRADMLVLSKTDLFCEEDRKKVLSELGKRAPGTPVILTRHMPVSITDVMNSSLPVDGLNGQKVMLVCGIGDPEYFRKTACDAGAEIVAEIFYGDHHRYTQKDIFTMRDVSKKKGAELILTTSKDFVKLKVLDIFPVEDKFFVLNIKMDICKERESLSAGLDSLLDSQRS